MKHVRTLKGRHTDLSEFLTTETGGRLPGKCIGCGSLCDRVGTFVPGKSLNRKTRKYESARDRNSPIMFCCMCGTRYWPETYGYCVRCRPKRMKEAITKAKNYD